MKRKDCIKKRLCRGGEVGGIGEGGKFINEKITESITGVCVWGGGG